MVNEGSRGGGVLSYLLALALIFSLNFVLPRMMPGDPLQAIYGDEALVTMTPEMEAHLIELFALDKPWSEQMLAYVLALLQGNLGFSYYYRDDVSSVIMGALPWTLLLVGLSLVIATIVGVALGIESGYRRGETLDRGSLPGSCFLEAFRTSFRIVLLLIFGVSLNLFPLSGALTPYSGLEGFGLVLDIATTSCRWLLWCWWTWAAFIFSPEIPS